MVATLVDDKLVYTHPIDTYQYHYNGQMYRLRSQQVDLDVTMDHELYVKESGKCSFELVPAIKTIGKRIKFKKNCLSFDNGLGLTSSLVTEGSMVTDNKQIADKLSIDAIHAGLSVSINEMDGKYLVSLNETNNEPEIDGGNVDIYSYNDDVYCLEVPSHVFMIRQNNKNVWVGNCSRHGQKGTCGILLPATDMPFTKNGLQPDICVNANAIPSKLLLMLDSNV